MRCCVVQRKLDLYQGHGLDAPQREQIERHLRSCPDCQQALARQIRLQQLLQSCDVPPVSEDFAARVLAQTTLQSATVVHRPPPRPPFSRIARHRFIPAFGMVGASVAGLLIGWLLGYETWKRDAQLADGSFPEASVTVSGMDHWLDPGDDALARTYWQLTLPRDG